MGLIVQKFGGTSVKDRDRIFNVARIVANTRNQGNDVVVVVSAQGDTTDDLITKAAEITSDPSHREMDMLLEESDIDAILKGQTDGYTEKAVRIVEYQAQEFINDLFSTLRERMIDLRSGTVVFVGGGAILLRRQIEASGKIGRLIFVDEINANAKGYEFLYQLEMAGR